MQNIHEKNWNAFRNKYPNFEKRIVKAKEKLKEDIIVQIECKKEGEGIVKVKKNKRELYLSGKRKPMEPAVVWAESIGKMLRYTPIFLFGIGNASYIKEILKKADKEINILLYEPSLFIFLEVMNKIDISEIFEKYSIAIIIKGVNDDELDLVINGFLNLGNIVQIREMVTPNYDILYLKDAQMFIKKIYDRVDDYITGRNTRLNFSKVNVWNNLHNAMFLPDSYKAQQLVVIPDDVPAIIVAAGPSLNKNIAELKRAKNKAFIIACDTAMKPLIREGIIPDMYATVDGKKPSMLVDVEEAKEIPLLCSMCSAYEIMEGHKGKKFFFNEGYTLFNNLFYKNGIKFEAVNGGGSVATYAFSLAYMLGFERIILVGQDLSFTNNKTHADGTFKEKMEEVDTSHLIMVEGNYEDKVPCRGDYKVYLDWYNKYIEACKKAGELRVINATEGGAKIENTELMTLKEAIDAECNKEVDIASYIKEIRPVFNKEQRKKVIEELHKTEDFFKEIKKQAIELIKIYRQLDKMVGSTNKRNYLNILKRIKRRQNKLNKNPVMQLISETLVIADSIIQEEAFVEKETFQEEIKEIARKGILYMEQVKKCAELFLPVVRETVGSVE